MTIVWSYGGSDGRQLVWAIAFATIATLVVHQTLGLENSQPFVILIDTTLLVFCLYVAARSVYFWPIWFSGFHMVAVASGFARFAFPSELPTIYTNMAGFWAIPALLAATIGVLFDHRAVEQGQ